MQRVKRYPSLENEDMYWPLKVFTLGRFSILIDGSSLRFTGKAQHKPLELLKTLIALGGREVCKYQLADALWPETDGDKSQCALKITLHRLRKIIRTKKIIQFREHRITLDARYCWVDVWVLERLLGKIKIVPEQSNTDDNELSSFTDKILNLYNGPFLEVEVDNPFVLRYREHLHHKFLRKLFLIGMFFEKSGQWERAADIYLRALEGDELAEDFYQRLMVCYKKQGFESKAMSVYQRCYRTLSSMGIEPSTKTKAIRDQ